MVVGHAPPTLLTADREALSSVDFNDLAGDLSAVLAREMDDDLADLLDGGGPAHGIRVDLLAVDGAVFHVGEAGPPVEIRVEIAGLHAVNSDSKPGQLDSRRLREHLEPSLSHAVRNEARLRLLAFDTGHVDDTALSLDQHVLEQIY